MLNFGVTFFQCRRSHRLDDGLVKVARRMLRLIVTVGSILFDLGGLKYKYKISYKYKHKCVWSVRLIVTVGGIAVPALDARLGSLLSARFHSTSQFKIQIQIHIRIRIIMQIQVNTAWTPSPKVKVVAYRKCSIAFSISQGPCCQQDSFLFSPEHVIRILSLGMKSCL